MTIIGEIQNAAPNRYTTAKGKAVDEIRLIVMDRSKLFRCMTPFQFNLSKEEFAVTFGKKKLEELTDEKCTIVATSLSDFGGRINCQGHMRLGHLAAEAINAEVQKPA